MKAIDINNFFISQANWIDPVNTVDKIIIGNPDKEIKRILVSWMSDIRAVEQAIHDGYDMLMTHEPTFWIHANELDTMSKWEDGYAKQYASSRKKELIESSGLVILRNHDIWDRMPKVGIPWAFADFLGFMNEPIVIGGNGYQHRYDTEPITVKELALNIAKKTALIGEPHIQLFGNEDALVSKVGIGTGCACSIENFISMGCDISIVCDDGSCYWSDIQWAIEIDHPIIRVNHATSEEPGMITLAQYINDNLQGVSAHYLPFDKKMKTI